MLSMAPHLVNVAETDDGNTALHVAAFMGFESTAKALLDVVSDSDI
jgi:ankyrin repeat protein